MRPIRSHYASVMATLAMFVALGGTSYAVIKLPRNSVGARQLRANAVTSAKIRNATIRAADLSPGARSLRGPRGPAGPAGAPGAAGAAGSTGAGAIIVRTRDALAARPDPGPASFTPVVSAILPAGRWLVVATTEITNITVPAGRDIFRCYITVDGADRGLGKVTDSGNGPGATSSSDVTLLEVVDKAAPAAVSLRCGHDSQIGDPSDTRFDRSKLVAIPVDSADVAEVAG
ncbi:MAG: hypothetical protein QOE11_3588 [Solirubrobacteraceae bacterium]|jgi:hypothetical protein|nr:hypothetical protein [Solirubrobacteraceae bacterium]